MIRTRRARATQAAIRSRIQDGLWTAEAGP